MEYMKLKYSFLAVLILLIISCDVVDLEHPAEDTEDMMEILPSTIPDSIEDFEYALHGGTERAWSTISFTLAGLEGVQDCRLDDVVSLRSDGTYTYDGGANLCGAEDNVRMRTGTWRLINNGNNILFDEGLSNEYTANVEGLEDNRLVLTGQYIGLVIRGVYDVQF